MSSGLALSVAMVLIITAALHAYWAFGGLWPAKSEQELARTVVGANGITKMPGRNLTLVVSLLIFLAGIWPLAIVGLITLPLPEWLVTLGMIVITLVMLARGFGGYLPVFRNANAEQPFAQLDMQFYSPIIIALGLSCLLILLLEWSAS